MTTAAERRVAVVTGGCSGIGAALAAALTPQWQVVVADLAEPASPVPGVTYLRGDLAEEDDSRRLAAAVEEIADTGVHALVHCAAIGGFGRFLDTPRATWERLLRVNLHGTLATVQAFGPQLLDGGRVVLFSSGTVFRAPAGTAAYAASKAGVIGFARALAEELGERRITVNVVAPGLVLTPLSEDIAGAEAATIATRAIKRASTVDDYVEPVRFLLSDGAAFVTGQTLVVDGGSTRH